VTLKGWTPPSYGIEVVEGRPGSGKSFFGVGRVLEAVTEQRRPVYTNLPLHMRVFRRWLRSRYGADVANLVRPLTPEHFTKFLARQAARNRFLDRLAGSGLSNSEKVKLWYQGNGPDVDSGTEANWISAFAMIIIDEAHHWYPQHAQRAEDPFLLTYLTMIRHHLHHLYVMTQDRMQVSITFRRLAAFYWHVRHRASDKLAWGLRLGHFGVNAFAYAKYTPEQEEARSAEGAEPTHQETVFPWLPSERWKFRLYNSFTHLGSPRELQRQLKSIRESAGLLGNGASLAVIPKPEGSDMPTLVRRFASWGVTAALLAAAVGLGSMLARPVVQAAPPVEFTPPKLSGFAGSKAILDGKPYAIGTGGPFGLVEFINAKDRFVLVRRDESVWMLRPGKPSLSLGDRTALLAWLNARASAAGGSGGSVAGSPTPGGSPLAAEESNPGS